MAEATANLPDRAAQLKEQGNKLFSAKEYVLASAKYTEAIEADGTNAVLYANRAACRLHLKQYLDAATDAAKATTIDPQYPKAYARLAIAHDALGEYWNSVTNWGRALDVLPTENLTPAELKQKHEYQGGLDNAQNALVKLQGGASPAVVTIGAKDTAKMPWFVGYRMIPRLEAEGNFGSSAWVICGAHTQFVRGIQAMNSLQKSGQIMLGKTGALEDISNAIIQDSRVFHIADSNWLQMYNKQVILEVTETEAWTEVGPEMVIKDSQERLAAQGWGPVRRALSVTIRGWIMRGFLDSGLRGNNTAYVEFVTRAVDVLKWGLEAWKEVSKEDRGAIFSDTFLRGVRVLRLDALMKAYNPKSPSAAADLEDINKEADDIVREVDANPAPSVDRLSGSADHGFVSAFFPYCKGRALSMKGFYYARKAAFAEDASQRQDLFRDAAMAYMHTATCFPDDDENYTWFLSCAISNIWSAGPAPIGIYLDIFEKMRLSIPKMQTLWQHSSTAREGRDSFIQKALSCEKDIRAMLASPGATRNSLVNIQKP